MCLLSTPVQPALFSCFSSHYCTRWITSKKTVCFWHWFWLGWLSIQKKMYIRSIQWSFSYTNHIKEQSCAGSKYAGQDSNTDRQTKYLKTQIIIVIHPTVSPVPTLFLPVHAWWIRQYMYIDYDGCQNANEKQLWFHFARNSTMVPQKPYKILYSDRAVKCTDGAAKTTLIQHS